MSPTIGAGSLWRGGVGPLGGDRAGGNANSGGLLRRPSERPEPVQVGDRWGVSNSCCCCRCSSSCSSCRCCCLRVNRSFNLADNIRAVLNRPQRWEFPPLGFLVRRIAAVPTGPQRCKACGHAVVCPPRPRLWPLSAFQLQAAPSKRAVGVAVLAFKRWELGRAKKVARLAVAVLLPASAASSGGSHSRCLGQRERNERRATKDDTGEK